MSLATANKGKFQKLAKDLLDEKNILLNTGNKLNKIFRFNFNSKNY